MNYLKLHNQSKARLEAQIPYQMIISLLNMPDDPNFLQTVYPTLRKSQLATNQLVTLNQVLSPADFHAINNLIGQSE